MRIIQIHLQDEAEQGDYGGYFNYEFGDLVSDNYDDDIEEYEYLVNFPINNRNSPYRRDEYQVSEREFKIIFEEE